MAVIRSRTDRLTASNYVWQTFKLDVIKDAAVGAASASAAFDAMKASIIANLAGANILRITIVVDTDE